jgi:uncharacterized protein
MASVMARLRLFCCLLLLSLGLLLPSAAAWAVSADDLPAQAPLDHVLDTASALSRSTRAEMERRLTALEQAHISASVVTLRRPDYGLTLDALGDDLLTRWQQAENGQLLLLIDTQSNTAAVRGDSIVERSLPADLLESTATTTMAQPLRDGGLYRQALVAGLDRLETVLGGGEDPGPPAEIIVATPEPNVPTAEETASSNALTWIIVLMVVGTVVPMATWWVFSR